MEIPTIELSILNVVVLLGALQGLILSIIFLTTKRLQRTSNRYLALLIFTFAIINIQGILELLGFQDPSSSYRFLPLFWVLLIPPSLYFFLTYLIDPNYNFKKKDHLMFVPFLLHWSLQIWRFIHQYFGNILSQSHSDIYYFANNTFELGAVIATLYIIIIAIRRLKNYESQLYENYAEVEEKSLKWLKNTLIAGLGICLVWLVVTISDFVPSAYISLLANFIWISLSIMIYWVGYSIIIRQELLTTPIFAIAHENEKKNVTNELSEKTDIHFTRLKSILEKEELYRDQNLNMSMLAERTGLSNGYLSQIINAKVEQNFFDFINSYRVEDVKRLMTDPAYNHYSLLGLANEAGFKSKSTFNAVFKKMTGITPSAYKKKVQPLMQG